MQTKNELPTIPGLNASAQSTLLVLMVTALLLALFLPPLLLTKFTDYTEPGGGSPIFKIHFYSYVLAIAFAFVVACRGAVRFASEQLTRQFGVTQFAIVVGVCATILVARQGTSGVAYLIDTLLAAPLAVMLMRYLSEERQNLLASLVIWVVVLNSAIAIVEKVFGFHLINFDNHGYEYFRATALFGYPLSTALITASVMFIVLDLRWSVWLKAIVLFICLGGILAVGSRGALGVVVGFGALCLLLVGARSLALGRLRLSTLAIAPWAALLGLAGVVWLVLGTSLGERIVGLAYFDESAEERIDAFRVFDYLSMREILSGVSPDRIEFILTTDLHLRILENFWVSILLMLGAILFVIFVGSLIGFCIALARGRGIIAYFALLSFLVVASTSNSLSTKSPEFILFAVALAGYRSWSPSRQAVTTPVRYTTPLREGAWS